MRSPEQHFPQRRGLNKQVTAAVKQVLYAGVAGGVGRDCCFHSLGSALQMTQALPGMRTLFLRCLRCPLRDVEDEEIERFFEETQQFIDAAAAAGGAALVHCHEGKSRSVTLVLAYMMQTQVGFTNLVPILYTSQGTGSGI